ncbi:Ppx/GppA family phosphatase [Novosphingobium sp. 1949]|uniref:Ppx/GppA family phosphatase n=1 Tax=Novosphingobium organovorum TaxID=2930092 RepID=A0ABT0BIS0_9SPHN|nr:Ppx/GppA family phosphatase [Novosphingobium organovorum]MCJ2184743.1 Ppx/GppA family phosphatase [Novosphingobium organovorum]
MIGISHSNAKRAIIDIGSNTVRLVIYGGPPRAPVVILNEKVNARLGRDLDRDGTLSEKALKTALTALERFARLVALHRVETVDCVATAAARDASNGPAFLEAVRGFGLAPRLLSGDEEARASAMGVLAAFPGAHGTVADLGGGSLELIGVEDGAIHDDGVTMPFGTLRLPELRKSGTAAFSAHVQAGIRATGWPLGETAGQGGATARGEPVYIVGGSWRAFALQAMRELNWPVDDPHGFALPAGEVLRLGRQFAKGKLENPDPRISSARQASLPDAAALLVEVITALEPSEIVFSSWGLREGLLHAQLPPEIQAEPPMLASVSGFAQGARVSTEGAVRVAEWCAPVCDDADHDGDLRQAATLLALVAMRTEPNLRTEEATTWALRKRWIGLDMRGRAMMAMTVFANAGLAGIPDPFPRLAAREDLNHAIGWGLAVRLCRRLHGGSARAIDLTRLEASPTRITLTLSEEARALYTASSAKDMKALAEWLGREWAVLGPDGAPVSA